ncbi:MAG: DUF11 domain-containing protein [Actinomycetota bacterium]
MGTSHRQRSGTGRRSAVLLGLVVALVASVVAAIPQAGAQGPPYSGPVTGAAGPAYFGPAPNPIPYCESPTYFDPFPENVTPIGRLDPGPGPEASVTTDGITMTLDITAEGITDDQYPGFFPFGGEGVANDQPKGVEMAAGDEATIALSEPLFYSQWVFTDIDRDNEGFFVRPAWTDPDAEIAVFAGDADFTFSGTSSEVLFNDTDTVPEGSEALAARVQVDLLGAVTGIDIERDTGSGQSGFAVGGGCEAAGASKALVAGPTWNGSSFDVSFELRIRNNLPSAATVSAAILAAQGAAPADFLTAAPSGISLDSLQLIEPLADSAFADIEILSVANPGGALPINAGYDGVSDTQVLGAGASLSAETDQLITLDLRYTPDLNQAAWSDCAVGYTYLNQATVSASAANVSVTDQSDDGLNPAPGDDNGAGGVDDATEVVFPCPPAGLDIVKTAVPGPNGTCPDFAGGTRGDGPALVIDDRTTVTYCISVANPGESPASSVLVSDVQNPNGDVSLGTIAPGGEASTSYDLEATLLTATTNTAIAQGLGPNGVSLGLSSLGPVSDTAVISVTPLPEPSLDIVKTVIEGPGGLCPTYDDGVEGVGPALGLLEGETATYCLSVRNSGPGDATNVAIADAQAPAGFDGSIGNLAVDDDATRSFDVIVGEFTPTLNTATVSGNGPYGPVASAQDSALIEVSPQPDPVVQIVKTAIVGPNGTCPDFAGGVIGAGPALPAVYGETVTYCITVANSGGNPATGVTITDAQAPAGFDGDIGLLAIGAQATRSYDVVVDATTPALNTAVVNGSGPNGALPTDSDQAIIDAVPQPDPVLQIVKTVLPGADATCPSTLAGGVDGLGDALPVLHGDTVTYCVTVRNDAGSDATAVLITDPQAPAGFNGLIGALAVGAEASRSFQLVVDASTPSVNTAAVGGTGPNGPVPDDTDQAQITASPQPDPVLEIVKTAVQGPGGMCPSFDDGVPGLGSPFPILFQDTVTYCISLRNIGGSAATAVTLTDAQAPAGFDGAIGTLDVGEVLTRSYDLVIEGDTPTTNTAQAEGLGPNGAIAPVLDTALIEPSVAPRARLDIVKTVVPGPDGRCPVFATGVPDIGPALDVNYGDTVTYCITAANLGLAEATDVVISDPQAPAEFDGAIGNLASRTEATRSFDLTITESTPLINTATVSGNGPSGPVPSVSDSALISSAPVAVPILAIVKTVVAGPNGTCPAYEDGVPGLGDGLEVMITDSVTYCVSARNIGDADATDVVITDPQAPGEFEIGVLAVGATVDASYDVTVSDRTPLRNTAVISGQGPEGTVSAQDDAQIAATEQLIPSISLANTVIPLEESCLQAVESVDELLIDGLETPVRWCFEITNTGNTALSAITFDDLPLGLSDLDILAEFASGESALAAGESIIFTAEDTIPENELRSLAAVEATPSQPDGTPIVALGDVTATNDALVIESGIELQKQVVAGADGDCAEAGETATVNAGASVTWCFTVTNVGGVDLAVDEVIDATLGLAVAIPAADRIIAPAGSVTVSATTAVAADTDNEADVVGIPVDEAGEPYPDTPVTDDADQASVDTLQADLAIVKSSNPDTLVFPGSTVTYTLQITNLGPDAAEAPSVSDELPAGLSYEVLPDTDGWACAVAVADDFEGGQSFESLSCAAADALEVDGEVTLTYTVRVPATVGAEVELVNAAAVGSSTPDPDESNNRDDNTVETPAEDDDPVIDVPTGPPDPGPFTPPPAPAPPVPAAPPLAVTGASSRLLTMASIMLLMLGGVLNVGSRRRDERWWGAS